MVCSYFWCPDDLGGWVQERGTDDSTTPTASGTPTSVRQRQCLCVSLSNVDRTRTVDDAIAEFTEHRAIIEQAKGVLMTTYGISAERAFEILVWRSQETNTKLRTLASQIVDDFTSQLTVPDQVRQRADHLLLTAHRRVRRAGGEHDNAC